MEPTEYRALNPDADWDPASKQPLFKSGAARLERIALADGVPAAAPTNTASAPSSPAVPDTVGGPAGTAHETTEAQA